MEFSKLTYEVKLTAAMSARQTTRPTIRASCPQSRERIPRGILFICAVLPAGAPQPANRRAMLDAAYLSLNLLLWPLFRGSQTICGRQSAGFQNWIWRHA